MLLCNRLIAAEEKSACLILKLLHMFNFHGTQILCWLPCTPGEIASWVESCTQRAPKVVPIGTCYELWAGTQRHP